MKLSFTPAPGSPWREVSFANTTEEMPTVIDDIASSPVPVPEIPPEPSFLGPLPTLCCPGCPDRSQFYQARQQAGYYRALFDAAKKREAGLEACVAHLE